MSFFLIGMKLYLLLFSHKRGNPRRVLYINLGSFYYIVYIRFWFHPAKTTPLHRMDNSFMKMGSDSKITY